jgi:hypothetical protein
MKIAGGLFYLGDTLPLGDGRSTDQYAIKPQLSATAVTRQVLQLPEYAL